MCSSDLDDWQTQLVTETTQLTRQVVQAQIDLGNELGLPERQRGGGRSGGSSRKPTSNGPSSTSGTGNDDDPDRFPYEASAEGVTPGQVKFLSSLLDERGLAIGDFLPLLNKESAKRAIHRMYKKGLNSEDEIFAGIL